MTRFWITIEQGDVFTIPAGVQQYPMKVTINVPDDAELGKYDAFVRVKTTPQAAESAGEVAIALGGRVDIDVTVGDDVIVEFKIKGLSIFNIKEGEPLRASVVIDNTGNVPVSPDSASFELFDKFGSNRLAFASASSDQFDSVDPFSEGSVVLEFPIDIVIAPGEYWGHVKIFDTDGRVARELRTVFNVEERTLADMFTSAGFLFVFAAVVVLVFFVRRHRRRMQAVVSKAK